MRIHLASRMLVALATAAFTCTHDTRPPPRDTLASALSTYFACPGAQMPPGVALATPDAVIAHVQLTGSIPLYRMYSAAQRDHFYTTSWHTVQSASGQGYRYESVVGYVWPSWALAWNAPPTP